jgi:very-short-patch-repair endonuclease
MHIGRARKLRQSMTDAERGLWSGLRDRRLEGLKFRRQQPIGAYIADFVCVEAMLVVEADGSQHRADERLEYDWRRTQIMGAEGCCVLRFDNVEILRHPGQVLSKIAAKAAERRQMLHGSSPSNGRAASPHQSRR